MSQAFTLKRVLAADTAGHGFNKAYEYSHIALAAATIPAVFAGQGTTTQKVTDFVLACSIPIHSHISMNALVTDYLPRKAMPVARGVVLGLSVVTYVGLMKLNFGGAGICDTIKSLWRRPVQ